jgi:large subunit ribosomal protein L25
VDLHEVAENEKVTVMVPVDAVGEPVGVKTGGGTLEHVLFKLKVRALPKDLPESLIADVSHLEIGKAVHVGEMKAPPGVEILGDKHLSVLAVAAPLSEAQEAAVLEAAATPTSEVEMIKEKKEAGTEVEAKPGEKTAAKAGEGAAAKPGEKGEKAGAKPGEKAAPAAEKAGDKKGGEKKKH